MMMEEFGIQDYNCTLFFVYSRKENIRILLVFSKCFAIYICEPQTMWCPGQLITMAASNENYELKQITFTDFSFGGK